jgi:anti-sigma-K factor RskA
MAEHSWLDEHVELYAINALDDDEENRLERALAQEPEPVRSRYLREIARTREALVQMTEVDATPPPPQLREALLAALPSELPEVGEPSAKVINLAERRRRFSIAVGAVAAALILVIGGVMVGRVTAPEEKAPASALEQQTMAILGSPDMQLQRDTLSDGGSVIVAASREANQAVVIAEGLPPTPVGQTYQMWLLGEGHDPTSVGTMGAEPVRQAVPIADLTGSDRIAVTIEPEGGSPQPTGEVVTNVSF